MNKGMPMVTLGNAVKQVGNFLKERKDPQWKNRVLLSQAIMLQVAEPSLAISGSLALVMMGILPDDYPVSDIDMVYPVDYDWLQSWKAECSYPYAESQYPDVSETSATVTKRMPCVESIFDVKVDFFLMSDAATVTLCGIKFQKSEQIIEYITLLNRHKDQSKLRLIKGRCNDLLSQPFACHMLPKDNPSRKEK